MTPLEIVAESLGDRVVSHRGDKITRVHSLTSRSERWQAEMGRYGRAVTETMLEPPSPDTIRRRQEAKRKQEERARHEWGAFKRRVARDDQAKAQAREAEREMLARMTVERQVSYLANKNSTVPRSDESFGAGWQIARQELRAEELAARDEERRQREDREGVTKERAIWEGELTHRQNDAVAKHARVEEPHAAEKAAEHEAIDDELEQWKASHPEPSLELLAAQGA